jgi:hypothetical protein
MNVADPDPDPLPDLPGRLGVAVQMLAWGGTTVRSAKIFSFPERAVAGRWLAGYVPNVVDGPLIT